MEQRRVNLHHILICELVHQKWFVWSPDRVQQWWGGEEFSSSYQTLNSFVFHSPWSWHFIRVSL